MRRPANSGKSDADERGGVFDTASLIPRRSPLLFQFLSDDHWDDGAPRVPGTLLLFAEGGRFKACLNDRDSERSVFQSGESLEAILEALELGLEADSLEWRAKPGQAKKGRK